MASQTTATGRKLHKWDRVIISFTPSWFTVCMGTGVNISLTANFPWDARWLHDISYIFWITTIVLFISFLALTLLRFIRYPFLIRETLTDFQDSCYLGCIPIALNTIINGIVIHYAQRPAAVWVAFSFWCISSLLSLLVSAVIFFYMIALQQKHELSKVTGLWLLAFIPQIVSSATGGLLSGYLGKRLSVTVAIISFLMWSFGVSISCLILGIYLWRLMAYSLPPRSAIVSSFIQVGPLGMGAYSIQILARFLSAYLRRFDFAPSEPMPISTPSTPSKQTTAAIEAAALSIHWSGILIALFLIGHAHFWLLEATCSVVFHFPKDFSIGYWAFTFPFGVLVLAIQTLAKDLNNTGLRIYGAILTVFVILLWMFCVLSTLILGVWQGKAFHSPDLERWVFEHDKSGLGKNSSQRHGSESGFQQRVFSSGHHHQDPENAAAAKDQ